MNYWDAIIEIFIELKSMGVSKEEVLDVLEFDSNQYPDHKTLEAARDQVYGK